MKNFLGAKHHGVPRGSELLPRRVTQFAFLFKPQMLLILTAQFTRTQSPSSLPPSAAILNMATDKEHWHGGALTVPRVVLVIRKIHVSTCPQRMERGCVDGRCSVREKLVSRKQSLTSRRGRRRLIVFFAEVKVGELHCGDSFESKSLPPLLRRSVWSQKVLIKSRNIYKAAFVGNILLFHTIILVMITTHTQQCSVVTGYVFLC